MTLQAGSSTGGAGGSIILKPGGTDTGTVGEVAMQSAAGTDLFRVNENSASIGAQQVAISADSDGGDAAASIVLNSDAATVEISGTVVLQDTLTVGETMLFGDMSTRMPLPFIEHGTVICGRRPNHRLHGHVWSQGNSLQHGASGIWQWPSSCIHDLVRPES